MPTIRMVDRWADTVEDLAETIAEHLYVLGGDPGGNVARIALLGDILKELQGAAQLLDALSGRLYREETRQ